MEKADKCNCRIKRFFPAPIVARWEQLIQLDEEKAREVRRGLWEIYELRKGLVRLKVTYFDFKKQEIFEETNIMYIDNLHERAKDGCICAKLAYLKKVEFNPQAVFLPELDCDGIVSMPDGKKGFFDRFSRKFYKLPHIDLHKEISFSKISEALSAKSEKIYYFFSCCYLLYLEKLGLLSRSEEKSAFIVIDNDPARFLDAYLLAIKEYNDGWARFYDPLGKSDIFHLSDVLKRLRAFGAFPGKTLWGAYKATF